MNNLASNSTAVRPFLTYNDDTSATQCGTVLYDNSFTFYPTCPNEPAYDVDEEKVMAEIERLDKMMLERDGYSDSKRSLQHKANNHARLAPAKHKKPHMTRRIIR